MALFLPAAAGCTQSAWVVLVKGINLYQAVIGAEIEARVCIMLTAQAAISFCLLRPLLRYVVLQRLAALVIFWGWLCFDFSITATHR